MPLRNPILRSLAVALIGACFFISPSASQAGDWKVHEADMTAFQIKMQSLEKEIQELVEKRKGTEEADAAKQINDDIATKYAELKKTHDDYDAEKLHMRFQHPEKGDLAERNYPRMKLQTLKDLETDLSLDGQLDRMRDKLKTVYGLEPIHKGLTEGTGEGSRAPASVNAESEQRTTLKN